MQLSFQALCVIGIFLIRSTVTAVPAPPLTTDSVAPNYWFSFADSYTSTGFTPWGPLPVPENPFGNPPYPGYTFTGGPYWINYLTTTYNKSLTLTYNFAVAGATINETLVPPILFGTFENQVNTYLRQISNKVPWKSNNTLFSIWVGINDIGLTYEQPGDRVYFPIYSWIHTSIWLKDYQTGARLFYFINIPPVHRSPVQLQLPIEERDLEKKVIQGHNAKLATRITNFGRNHPDVKTWFWDSYAAFTTILDNPTQYGFKNIVDWNPDDPTYFWGDNYHPGSAANNVFAQAMRNSLEDFPW